MILMSLVSLALTPLFYVLLTNMLPLVLDQEDTVLMINSVIWLPLCVSFLYAGGLACIDHFALRLTLYRAKLIPWNFVTFFQQADDRLFIQRTGGSYIFLHRYLQEHFASLAPED